MLKQAQWIGIGVLLLLSAACSTVIDPQQQFEPVVDDFTQRLRWKDYVGASRHLVPENQKEFLERLMGQSDLQITDVRLQKAELLPDGRMETWSILEYYLLPSATVRELPVRQEWVYLEGGTAGFGSWRIATPFPAFPP